MSKEFEQKKYTVIRNAISKELADFLYKYLLLKEDAVNYMFEKGLISPYEAKFGYFGDHQTNGQKVFCCYGDFAMDTLLQQLKTKVENVLEKKIDENYSYVRLYIKDSELKPHKDRDACGTSTTLNLGGDPWPIFIKTDDKAEPFSVTLDPGDMLLYNGVDCLHWREKFKGEFCGQVFLHYSIIGETKVQKYDGRPKLGLLRNK